MANIIEQMRRAIPNNIKCPDWCHQCCFCTMAFTDWEWEQTGLEKLTFSYPCQFKTEKGCGIYEQRPIICRLFGTVPGITDLQCPHVTVRPENALPVEIGAAILRQWRLMVLNSSIWTAGHLALEHSMIYFVQNRLVNVGEAYIPLAMRHTCSYPMEG